MIHVRIMYATLTMQAAERAKAAQAESLRMAMGLQKTFDALVNQPMNQPISSHW
jgi:uncharacterized iron-regulated protein